MLVATRLASVVAHSNTVRSARSTGNTNSPMPRVWPTVRLIGSKTSLAPSVKILNKEDFEARYWQYNIRLLPDRKLKNLLLCPFDNLPETKDGFSLLLFWYWEECLKQRYEKFVIALEESLKDMLQNLKDKAMKAVVIQEVDSFIFRPHIGLRAKYRAVNFLIQILLSKKGDGPKVAKHLLDVYFAVFKVALQRPPQYACGCLFLMSEVLKANPTLWATVLQNESVDDDLEQFEDIIEDPDPVIPSTNNSVNSGGSVSQNGGKLNPLCKDGYGSVGSDSKDQSQKTEKRPALPAGYDPRHREPSFCNADRSSWWELMVLASHAHPSVATMARTLLSGANIVYNGDSINDLSLNAFLDKFMEKKPKPNKRTEEDGTVDPKLPLQESDEDELAPDADAIDSEEELVSDGSDESEEEEIDNILGSGPITLEEEKSDYEYDDLDTVAGEDDDDLLGEDSDAELGSDGSSDDGGDVSPSNKGGSSSGDDGSLDIWGDDSPIDDDDGEVSTKSSKMKKGNKRKSPFASIEDYKHLMKEDGESGEKLKPRKKRGKLSN